MTRPIRISDAAAVCNFIAEAEQGLDDVRAGSHAFNRPEVIGWYEHKLSNLDAHGVLMEEGGKIVGVALCIKDIQDKSTSHVGYVSVIIAKEKRKQGAGKLLAWNLIRKGGHDIYFAEILHTNKASIKLFESLGFVKCSEMPDAVRKNGKSFNKLMYYYKRS